MDESVDLFDDSIIGADHVGSDEPAPSGSASDDVDSSGSDDLEIIITDILGSYFNPDENEENSRTGEDSSVTDSGENTEPGENTDSGTEMIPGKDTGSVSAPEDSETTGEDNTNTEILSEMNETLHTHTDSVQAFFSNTVSGNAVVTYDDNAASLLTESIGNQTLFLNTQTEILDSLGVLNHWTALLFVVLVFDMLHRFAKRIVRNLMKGDRKNNGTDT